jgi:hypothetical protein
LFRPEPWNLKGIDPASFKSWTPDEKFVTGLNEFRVELQEKIKPEECGMIEVISTDEGKFFVDFKVFPPGSVVAFEYGSLTSGLLRFLEHPKFVF